MTSFCCIIFMTPTELCLIFVAGGDFVPVSRVWSIWPAKRSEGDLPHAVWHAGECHRRADHQVGKAAWRTNGYATCNISCSQGALTIYTPIKEPSGVIWGSVSWPRTQHAAGGGDQTFRLVDYALYLLSINRLIVLGGFIPIYDFLQLCTYNSAPVL